MPKQRGKRQTGKAAKSKSKLSSNKRIAIFLVLLMSFSGIILIVAMPQAQAVDQYSLGEIGMGDVACDVNLDTKPLVQNADGTYSPILLPDGTEMQNAPWYIGEVEVNAIEFIINIIAWGDYVDWSTLTIDVSATANDIIVGAKTVPSVPLEITAGGFSEVIVFRITDIDAYIREDVPDTVLEDGTKFYDFECIATAVGYIEDAKGNDLSDTVTIRHPWTLNTLPDGSFNIDSEEAIKPSFLSAPGDAKTTQGIPVDLFWQASDDNPATYVIKTYTPADGSQVVAQGTWVDQDTLSYDKAASYVSLEPGDIILKVTCTLIDEDGQQTIDSVTIEITVPSVPTAPTFQKSDGPLTSPSGVVEIFITFHAVSDRPSSYKIYVNGDLKTTQTWTGGDILYEVTFLYAGTNTIKCVAIDTLGQSSSYTHAITTPSDDDPGTRDDPRDPGEDIDPADPGLLNAPWSLGDVQGISLFMGLFFVGFGLVVFYIMKRGK